MSVTDFRCLQATFVPRHDAPGQGRLFFWCMPPRRVEYARRAMAALGLIRKGKTPPLGRIDLVIPTPTRNKTDDWEIAGLTAIRLPLMDTIRALVRLDTEEARRQRVSDSVRIWSMAAKLGVELVAAGHMVPILDRNDKDHPYARWAITSMTPETRQRIRALEEALPIAAHSLVLDDGQGHESARRKRKNRRRRQRKVVTPDTTVWKGEVLLRLFLDSVADALVREASPSTSRDRPRKDNRELAAWEFRWRYSLTASEASFEHAGLVEQPLVDEITRWASRVRPRLSTGTAFGAAFQLEEPGSSPEASAYPDMWYLRFLLQANDDPTALLDAQTMWKARTSRVVVGDRTFVNPQEVLLESLADLESHFPPISRALSKRLPEGVALSNAEAWQYISETHNWLRQVGYASAVPHGLASGGRQRLRPRLHVGAEGWSTQPSKVGVQALASFRWQVALGDAEISPEEFRAIAALQQPLVRWRGEWMAVDPEQLQKMKTLFEGAQSTGQMDRSQALAAALTGTVQVDGGEIEVVAEGEIARLIDGLKDRDREPIETPGTFHGELRPYQQRGLTWLAQLTELGFGACLADDMGLGKTIQVIAALLSAVERGTWSSGPALLVCPTSVLGNWEHEFRKFGPSLRVVRYHGRNREQLLEQATSGRDDRVIVLTTYVIARLDNDVLADRTWAWSILDEAQNIKNPTSQQALAIRNIPAERRVALTGTPVENRLAELWSILEFANNGLLGTLPDFRRRFAVPIERFGDQTARDTLRRLVGFFILRRVKSDPNVIQDLPEKQEYKVICSLTREQASVYQATVDQALDKIAETTGVARRGNILALLTRLKQICNHPVHFSKKFDEKLGARSGKLTRLVEMVDEVLAEDERALIFTQYREMGDLLQRHLRERFGVDPPFIHGGVPAEARDRIVAEFQQESDGPPILLLSLKAGGTGLNLTRATHVFHFDRWWNPAVEDQATDRAYRVGQTRNVLVHKLIVMGTVEEKIDEILESKRDLADSIVDGGEAWITELSDTELRELFTLGSSAAIDDDEQEVG